MHLHDHRQNGEKRVVDIRRIESPAERRRFLTFPWEVYADDPLWVPPVLKEVERRIDPNRGPFFERGEADFFLAWRGNEVVGRICAAVDRRTNQARDRKDCLFGFFEAVPEMEVARALLARVEDWARGRGLRTLLGPYHLDYEDGYGVLVEGRDRPPAVLCGHTPAYYQDFFERLGFVAARADALAYEIPLSLNGEQMGRLFHLADYVRTRGGIRIRSADLRDWEAEVDRVFGLINRALAHLPNFIPWQREALRDTARSFVSIADPELILFAEAGGELVGWFPGVPNVNEALIHANGLRRRWDYIKTWWHMRKRPECLAIKSVLVPREYWDVGVPVLLFAEMAKRAQKKGYVWADLSLTSADNPTTSIITRRMGARVYKRYRVYSRQVP